MRKEKIIIYIFLVLIIITSSIYIYVNNNYNVKIVEESIVKTIKVDIKGAILNPGVKTMEIGSTVNDLIQQSGGLLENADTSMINLSKILENEMVVIVYTIDEINEIRSGSTSVKVIEKECFCPSIENDACIDKPNFIEIEDNTDNKNKISLNEATKEELMTLTGIGSTKADAIIEYRNKSKFNSIEEITNVKGIGQSTFEKIKDRISI